MCLFPSRRESITADLRGRVAQFAQKHDRAHAPPPLLG